MGHTIRIVRRGETLVSTMPTMKENVVLSTLAILAVLGCAQVEGRDISVSTRELVAMIEQAKQSDTARSGASDWLTGLSNWIQAADETMTGNTLGIVNMNTDITDLDSEVSEMKGANEGMMGDIEQNKMDLSYQSGRVEGLVDGVLEALEPLNIEM